MISPNVLRVLQSFYVLLFFLAMSRALRFVRWGCGCLFVLLVIVGCFVILNYLAAYPASLIERIIR